ncbi:MAG: biotin transporter BioY [Bacteroidota bacterium]
MKIQAYLVLFAAIVMLVLSAQIRIDLPFGIPITGQSLAVLLVAYLLGLRWGGLAIASYLIIGLLGLPVFAKGAAGWATLMGGSGGYLIGFLAGGAVTAWLGQFPQRATMSWALLAMTLGTLVILLFGIGRLTMLYGWEKALEYGLYPFWKGALIKVVLGGLFAYLFYQIKPSYRIN